MALVAARHTRPLGAAGLALGVALAACSGETQSDPASLHELCARFCADFKSGGCATLGDMHAAVEIVAQPNCDADSCEEFVLSNPPEYRSLYLCILSKQIDCGFGELPSVKGCDQAAIETAEAMSECERFPSLAQGACPDEQPDRYYCSSHFDPELGYKPPESPGCSHLDGGEYCCRPWWQSLPPPK